MIITQLQFSDLCRKYGQLLKVPAGVDGVRLLWALGGNESSFGQNIVPRHEDAYCYRGRYFDFAHSREWGCLHHCSYGPLQILHVNALGYSPIELITDAEAGMTAAVAFLNREIFDHQHADTLEHIADAFNSGNWRDAIIPQKYIADVVTHYSLPMPEKPPWIS